MQRSYENTPPLQLLILCGTGSRDGIPLLLGVAKSDQLVALPRSLECPVAQGSVILIYDRDCVSWNCGNTYLPQKHTSTPFIIIAWQNICTCLGDHSAHPNRPLNSNGPRNRISLHLHTAASFIIWPNRKPYLMNTESIRKCDIVHMAATFQLQYNKRIEGLYMHRYGQA